LRLKLRRGDGGRELAIVDRQRELGLLLVAQRPAALLRSGVELLANDQGIGLVEHAVRVQPLPNEHDQGFVEILAAEAVVAGRRANLDHAFEHLDDGYVERPAAEIEHQERLAVVLVVHSECQCGSGRLVEQAVDLEAGQLGRAARRLALAIVEIGRDGDDGLGHVLAKEGLGIGLQATEHHRGEVFRGEVVAPKLHLVLGADVALECGCRPVGRHRPAIERRLAREYVAVIRNADGRRGQQATQRVGDKL